MLLLQISSEAILGASALLAVIVAIIISAIVYFFIRRGLKDMQSQFSPISSQIQQANSDLNGLKMNLPRYEEIGEIKKQLATMTEQQGTFTASVSSTLDGYKRANVEEMDSIRRDIVKNAEAKSIEVAKAHVESNSVSRDEFDGLKERVDTVLESDEIVGRIELLGSLFDSGNMRTLVWQCKLIRLAQNGIAPDAEEDVLMQEGIPIASGKTFLKRLAEKGIVNSMKVESYYLMPEFTWMTAYAEDPDRLQRNLENHIMKEQEYQKHVRQNVATIEDGLLVVTEQYQVESGRIDILCRDKKGFDVALELKYPAANNEVIGQILRYKEDQRRRSGNGHMRFVVVAPKISTKLKELLLSNTIEYSEIPF
ncbi:MAG: endonuclease NucS domain-containing protein [Nitrososphaera sp.]